MPVPELRLTFDNVRDKNLEQLKTLSRAIFPIKYHDAVYDEIIKAGDLSRLAFYNDVLVGAIGSRLDLPAGSLYIVILGVLAPYRGMRVGTRLLQKVLDECAKHKGIRQVYLHVQANNEDAISFYKRFDFEVGDIVQGYYKRLDPSDAVVLHKTLVPA